MVGEFDLFKSYSTIRELDESIRGRYLFRTAEIDYFLNGLIARFFFPDDLKKTQMLVGYIINDISFSRKIDLFFKLVKKTHPEILNEYPNLHKQLNDVKGLRNKLAHCRLDTTMDTLSQNPNHITLEYWENDELKFLKFDRPTFELEYLKISELLKQLVSINEKIN